MDDIFTTPGALTLVSTSLCARCARKKVACLGASASR
jgi:hypothetical protein